MAGNACASRTLPEVGEAFKSGPSSPLTPTFAPGVPSLDFLRGHLWRTFVSQAPMTGAWDHCPTPSGGRPLPTSPGKQGNERSGHPAKHLTCLGPLLGFLSPELKDEQVAHLAVGSGPSPLVINQTQPSSGLLPH